MISLLEETKRFHGKGTHEDVGSFHHNLVYYLDSYYSRSRKLVYSVLKKKDWILRLVMDSDMKFTNNESVGC